MYLDELKTQATAALTAILDNANPAELALLAQHLEIAVNNLHTVTRHPHSRPAATRLEEVLEADRAVRVFDGVAKLDALFAQRHFDLTDRHVEEKDWRTCAHGLWFVFPDCGCSRCCKHGKDGICLSCQKLCQHGEDNYGQDCEQCEAVRDEQARQWAAAR